jgi:glycosyltransferase involved in cell wall biosynthesis
VSNAGLRILAIAESFFGDHRNGLARVAWDVARALSARGHEVHLLCPAAGPVAPETTIVERVAVTRYPRPRVSAFDPRNPWVHVAGYVEAIRGLSGQGPWDIVHCHGIYGMNAAADVFGTRIPKLLTVHSPAVLEQAWNWTHGTAFDLAKLTGLPLIRRFERRAVEVSTVCHSLSAYTRESMARLYREAEEKPWRVIPHWIDAGWWRRVSPAEARRLLGWPQETRIVLTVRQLKPRYGIDVAIRGLAAPLERCGGEFRIVGDGPQRGSLEALAAATGGGDHFIFEGAVSEARLRLAYQAADAFVIPSRALECFGLIALEAMAVGLPTVATMVGALPEILGPVTPELLVPPGDAVELGAAVSGVLEAAGSSPAAHSAALLVSHAKSRYAESDGVSMYERLFRDAIISN